MAPRKSRSSGSTPPPTEPQLSESLESVRAKVQDRIERGRELLPSIAEVASVDEIQRRRQKMYTWTEYNRTLLRRLLGPGADDEFRDPISFGGASDPAGQVRDLESDLQSYIRQLESILERLPLWAAGSYPEGTTLKSLPADGPIFVVHGSDLARANEVARLLERATDREVVILHEQPNRGRTLLEKFEQHAIEASFAVVVLTADDEGRKKGEDLLTSRGRQNVIFEMGFFFSRLGRERVVVLLDPSVEQPSDVNGLLYEAIDSGGAWKHSLLREVVAAGIVVDLR